jgi:MFS family permease
VQAGLTLSVANGAGIAGRIGWGALAGRGIDSLRMLALLACAMAAAAVLTAAFSPAWPAAAVMVVAALFGATAIGWNGVYLAEVAKLAPEGRIAEVTGGGLFFTYFGVFVGPAAFALLVEHGVGYGEAFIVMAIPVLVSGIRLLAVPPEPAPLPAPAHVTPSER